MLLLAGGHVFAEPIPLQTELPVRLSDLQEIEARLAPRLGRFVPIAALASVRVRPDVGNRVAGERAPMVG